MAAHIDRMTGLPIVPGRLSRPLRWTRGDAAKRAASDSRPALRHRERVLAAEADIAGAPVVATTHALYHRDPDALAAPEECWRRLALEEIGSLRWDPGLGVLAVTGFAAPPRRVTLRLRPGSRLAGVVRERVASTQIVGTRVLLPDGASALVTARRRPGADEVIWVVLLDGRADAADPATQAAVDSAIRELRAHAGL